MPIYFPDLLVYGIYLINKTYSYFIAIFQKQMRSVYLVGCSPSFTEQLYNMQPFEGFFHDYESKLASSELD